MEKILEEEKEFSNTFSDKIDHKLMSIASKEARSLANNEALEVRVFHTYKNNIEIILVIA